MPPMGCEHGWVLCEELSVPMITILLAHQQLSRYAACLTFEKHEFDSQQIYSLGALLITIECFMFSPHQAALRDQETSSRTQTAPLNGNHWRKVKAGEALLLRL